MAPDVRDLGGQKMSHIDDVPLKARVAIVLQRVGLLLLSYCAVRRKLLFLRSMFAAAGLHGIEGSRFPFDSVRAVQFPDAVLCGEALILYFHVSLALLTSRYSYLD